MKARYGNGCPIAAALCGAGGNSSLKSDSKVTKSKADEMQFYFSKLKELVPFMPKHRKLSKLEIIQYVIDYICDLQLALESHPATRSATAISTSPVSPGTSRQPLGPIAPSPNPVVVPVVNACGAQEITNIVVNHLDKIPPRLGLQLQDMGTRPVSC